MKQFEHGRGTVRTVRRGGVVVGYQALLPRALSEPPLGCKSPQTYQQALGPLQPTKEGARKLLDAAILELRETRAIRYGLPFAHYVDAEIAARLQEARRVYPSESKANMVVSTWRSIERLWLPRAEWFQWPPAAIEQKDLQQFVNWLRDEAQGKDGPLSASFIRNIVQLIVSTLSRAGVSPNPARELEVPSRKIASIEYLNLEAQFRLFGSERIDLEDRLMIGCGMGAGLRIGELLSLEWSAVRIDDADPHLLIRYGGRDESPTKSRQSRRVELFEPGLGFWRLWCERSERGPLVFEGPQGGYRKHWPEQFPGWATIAGARHLSSHVMRHSYAVALLSGSWGYEPRSMEFVSQQLGHSEITTTERHYAAFEAGTWAREVRRMTGRAAVRKESPVTALELLGRAGADARIDAHGGGVQLKKAAVAVLGLEPRHSPEFSQVSRFAELGREAEGSAHQTLQSAADLARGALQAIADGEPTAVAQAINALRATLQAAAAEDSAASDRVGGVA